MKKAVYFLTIITLAVFCGCSESDERRHPLYQKGIKAQQAGNGSEAAEYLEELLKRRPRSVYVHLRLAMIYDELLNEPFLAVLHYRKYLAAMPDAPDAEEVNAWLSSAEKRCYNMLKNKFGDTPVAVETPVAIPPEKSQAAPDNVQESPAAPAPENTLKTPDAPPADIAVFADQQKQIAALQQKLAQYQARHKLMLLELNRLRKLYPDKPAAVPEPEMSFAGSMKKYKVVTGDTPGKIAYKVYGKSSLFPVIMRANPHIDERKLRPGMILNIPPQP